MHGPRTCEPPATTLPFPAVPTGSYARKVRVLTQMFRVISRVSQLNPIAANNHWRRRSHEDPVPRCSKVFTTKHAKDAKSRKRVSLYEPITRVTGGRTSTRRRKSFHVRTAQFRTRRSRLRNKENVGDLHGNTPTCVWQTLPPFLTREDHFDRGGRSAAVGPNQMKNYHGVSDPKQRHVFLLTNGSAQRT